MASDPPSTAKPKQPLDPFRRAVLRGLGVLLPPLLTIVIFLWVYQTVDSYVFEWLEDKYSWAFVQFNSDIRTADELSKVEIESGAYVQVENGKAPKYVPSDVYETVADNLGADPMPDTAQGVYRRFAEQWRLLRRVGYIAVFILILYLFGKFLAAGIGRFFWNRFELLINRVPLVRNVYSSVKQVTDFLFTDPDLDANFTRVVAVEYPRKGIWTVAFVTGESMLDIESAANEPVMSVLIPTSPMPFTGFTITVKRSETIDLNITIDQAFQFVVSCGVVVPPQQLTEALKSRPNAKPSGEGAAADSSMTLAARTIPNE